MLHIYALSMGDIKTEIDFCFNKTFLYCKNRHTELPELAKYILIITVTFS